MTTLTMEEEFDRIIQEALSKAAKVDVSREDYEAALRAWIEEIQMALG